ncbi:GYD domain-containing protein [Dictyobacter formicarum]|uniref:GYD domain-containing protein n=1 Tax=Dictyobacter formicarum TaxID=2778368 RepID=A0ABQ3VKM9_9CHLR|nr:GYD domain-containing protein [Dictyobacter formicarum]GHO85666.1 GYD domain-containing protein [Dictyobacter formicarum]
MPTYVVLIKWTDQGVKNDRDTVQRARQYRSDVERRGGKLSSFYWTQGQYDMVSVIEAPDEQMVMATLLALESLGNVRTQTLRAFNETEMETIIQKM